MNHNLGNLVVFVRELEVTIVKINQQGLTGGVYLQKLYPLGLGPKGRSFDCSSEHLKDISEMSYFKWYLGISERKVIGIGLLLLCL